MSLGYERYINKVIIVIIKDKTKLIASSSDNKVETMT